MSRFTIQINNPIAEKAIMRLFEMLKNTPSIKFLQEGESIIIESSGNIEDKELSRMLPGEPMSWEELFKEIEQSEKDFQQGKYITNEQLKKEFRNW